MGERSGARTTWRAQGAGLALLAAALAGCARTPAPADWASVRELSPADYATRPALAPALAADAHGRVALAFVSRDAHGPGVWLALSADSGASFASPVRLDLRPGSVVAGPGQAPAVAIGPEGEVFVAWAAQRDSGRGADVVVRSNTGGVGFGPEVRVNADHDDARSPFHAGVALAVAARGRALVAWLDGRAAALAPGDDVPATAEVRAATSDDGGRTWRPDVRVAVEASPASRPALAARGSGLVAIAYRGTRGGARDPRLAISHDGGASFPWDTLLAAEPWRPSRDVPAGPALTLGIDGGACAWPTGAGIDGAGIELAPWRDTLGAVGPRRAVSDSVRDAGAPMLAALGATTLLGVLASPGPTAGRTVLAVRLLTADGGASPWIHLGANVGDGAIAAADARHAYAAWIELGETGLHLRLVRLTRR